MYSEKRIEKSPLTAPVPAMLPTPLNDMHHPHALTHPHPHAHLHALHPHHMSTHAHHVAVQQQMQQHLQQQQQHVSQQQQQQHVVIAPVQQHLVQHQQQQHALQQQQTHQQQQQHQQHQQQQQQHQHPQQQQQQQQQAQHTHTQHVSANQSQQQQTQQQVQQQQQSTMFGRFDANKSTKGASKLRRDLINAEIANLRDLLPLPQSTRQRLSQLQLMALVCVYVRKANYFQQVFKRHDISVHHAPTPNIGFSKALSGFLMMLTQNGKLLYISDNAAEYLGHSMEDLLIHGDSVYDIIDKQDHAAIQAELNRNVPPQPGQHSGGPTSAAAAAAAAISSLEGEHRMFLCRMNVSRNARRQMRFGDQKVVLVQGHYLSFLPLCSRNEPVFLATCTPIAMPETRECVVQGATNVFTTIHSMDMKIAHIDKNGEFHLGYNKSDIQGLSWYNLIHSDNLREAQSKHRLITQSEQDRSCILLVRMQRRQGDFIWVHVVLQVRDSQDTNQQPVIVCTNQVLNEREASVMIANSWLYHYYSVQSKIQFGLPFDGPTRVPPTTPAAAAAAAVYYHHHTHHGHPHSHPHSHHLVAAGGAPLPATAAGVAGSYTQMHSHTHSHPHHTHAHHPNHQQYHHMTAYGAYHTPAGGGIAGGGIARGGSPAHLVAQQQQQGQHQQHQQQQHQHTNGNPTSADMNGNTPTSNGGLSQFIYHHRLGHEPVDYSQVAGPTNGPRTSPNTIANHADMRCSSANSSVSSHAAAVTPTYNSHNNSNSNANHHRLSSPPAKKRAVGKLEPLYLPDDSSDEPSATTTTEIDAHYQLYPHSLIAGAAETHASVVFATVVPTRPRLLNKALATEPPDFIDQWNPSPPWSEAAQKISLDSSSSHQELSPCITTTPPTPTSAPPNGSVGLGTCVGGVQTLGPAFSFEWMSDPLVPPTTDACVSCITPPDGMPMVMTHHAHPTTQHALHWTASIAPTEHHQHLSQHLASHGHRLLSLSGGAPMNSTAGTETLSGAEGSTTKTEIGEDVSDKDSPRK